MYSTKWIIASYSFPSLYSIRIPGSSNANARATPAPGPGTVQQALIKTSCQVYGVEYTRQTMFPIIRDASLEITPPEQVGMTTHTVKVAKYSPVTQGFIESVGNREYCQTDDLLTIGINIPAQYVETMKKLFKCIGYWGQSSSVAYCETVRTQDTCQPDSITPLYKTEDLSTRGKFTCFLTSLNKTASWNDLMMGKRSAFLLELYIFPLVFCERHGEDSRLLRCSQTYIS